LNIVPALLPPAITAALLLCIAAGCVSYPPKPLTPHAIARTLAVPDDQTIRVAARELVHPVLKPVNLNLEQGLSPEEAGVLAVILNPDLRAQRDRHSIAGAQVLQAGLLPNPVVTAGVDFPHGAGPADSFTAYSIGADWDVTSLITRNARRRSADAQAMSVDLDIAWQEWQIAETAKTAAYDVLSLESQLQEAKAAERRLAENLAVVRRAYDQHQLALLDLSAAEAAAQEGRNLVLSQEKDLRHQRLLLNRSLGMPPDRKVDLRARPLPSNLIVHHPQRLIAEVETHRIDLLALKKGYESQDQILRAAILAQFPRINVGFNAARDTANVKTIGVGVTFELPIFDRNQGAIAVEKATRQMLFDEYASRVFTARSDIATAIADIESINIQIAAAEAAIPSLERLVRTYQRALQQGNADVLSFYTARSALAQKRIGVLKLKQQLVENWIAMEIASGQYLPIESAPNAPTTRPIPKEDNP